MAVFTFFVRSEIALFVALFAGISVFLNYRTLGYKNLILYGLLGAGISLAGMFAFNYWSVGNVMGMRAFTVLNDLTDSGKSELVRHLLIAKGYLYGDAEMRGIILAFPLVLSAALFFVPRLVRPLSSFAKACIFSGVGFIVLGSFLIPVKGGVQNFGLRYLDTGFLSLALGVTAGLDFWMKGRVGKQKWLALLVVLIMLYPAGKFLNTGIRTLTRSAPLYNKIQANFQEVGDGYVVHESLNTSYLVGISFLKQKHVYIATDESMRKLERSLSERKVQRFMIMHFDQTPYLTGALPKESYHNYFTKLTFKP
ncbi:MAG: hypothetical protein HY042_05700, partial [Spirochaetia bacterium]|nr:hypothetical protein [Spirochaetia bacterium]